jgi:predicted phosphate transport protein (TIGR00153 family)
LILKLPFIPREEKFFDLFQDSAENMVKAAHSLKEMINKWEHVEGKVAEITELEHKGDTITHEIMSRLNRTFVTPFDREDIVQLAHVLDDVTDFIHSAADAMLLYKVERPGERAKELADIIVQATEEIEKVLPQLKKRIILSSVLKRCVEINRLENLADRVYRSAIAELFDDSTDMAHIIKWREIYAHMESATDRCEDVADVLEGVAIKHA